MSRHTPLPPKTWLFGTTVVLALLFSSCLTLGTADSGDGNDSTGSGVRTGTVAVVSGGFAIKSGGERLPALGIRFEPGSDLESGLLIAGIPESSGAREILLPGDRVVSLEGKRFSSWAGFYSILLEKVPGEDIDLERNRDGTVQAVTFPLSVLEIGSDDAGVLKGLADGYEWNLAVVGGKIISYGYDDTNQDEWKELMNHSIVSDAESHLLNMFSRFDSFSVVDRRIIETILEEQTLGLTGIIEDPVRLGEMAGATHVLEISLTRVRDGTRTPGYRDEYTRRLIEVETGKLIASVTIVSVE